MVEGHTKHSHHQLLHPRNLNERLQVLFCLIVLCNTTSFCTKCCWLVQTCATALEQTNQNLAFMFRILDCRAVSPL